MRLEGETWANCFRDYKRSAWRLETHPVYTMPQERETYERFLSGETPTGEHAKDWTRQIANIRASGRTIARVRVLTRPLSGYIRYEFEWWYRFNAEAGEDIRILDMTDKGLSNVRVLGLPDHDFWLFDEERVVKMLYRPDGTQIARELVENPNIEEYLRYRDIALGSAIPFAEYWQGSAGT